MEEMTTGAQKSYQDKKKECVKQLFHEDGILHHVIIGVPDDVRSEFLDGFLENEGVQIAVSDFVSEIKVQLHLALKQQPDTNANVVNTPDTVPDSQAEINSHDENTMPLENNERREAAQLILDVPLEDAVPSPAIQQSVECSDPRTNPAQPVVPETGPADQTTAQRQLKPGEVPDSTTSAPKPAPIADSSKTSFTMSANGRANENYRGRVQGANKSGKEILIKQVDIPDGLGLVFDAETGEIFGIPAQAGEFELKVHFQFAPFSPDKPTPVGTCQLFVNPDPKTLWKNLESDRNDKYWKPDTDMVFASGNDGLTMIAASKRGRSHAHAGTFRDDDFRVDHDETTGWRIMTVADGAGSAKKSRRGSQLASGTANESVVAALRGERGVKLEAALAAFDVDSSKAQRPVMEELYYLFGNAAREAVRAISAEAAGDAAPYKDFSTTLIITIHKKFEFGHFVGSYWVGDGGSGAYHAGRELNVLGKADSGEFAGQTRFLDSSMVDPREIMSRIRFKIVKDFTAILAMTDGITDPKFETDANFENSRMWDALWSELEPVTLAENPGEALLDWLDFWSAGNHDDRTIAILCPLQYGVDHSTGR